MCRFITRGIIVLFLCIQSSSISSEENPFQSVIDFRKGQCEAGEVYSCQVLAESYTEGRMEPAKNPSLAAKYSAMAKSAESQQVDVAKQPAATEESDSLTQVDQILDHGNRYVGEVNEQGQWHGQGTYFWSDGEKYEGEWLNGARTGQGTKFFANGDRYEGEFRDGKYHGQGTYYWPDGRYHIGEWKNDTRTGLGTEYFPSGGYYSGEWKNSKRHGLGKNVTQNGSTVEGNFVNGKLHGIALETFATGRELTRLYENGKPIKVLSDNSQARKQQARLSKVLAEIEAQRRRD